MKFIGSSILKISAERDDDFKGMSTIDTNIQFKEIIEEKLKSLNNMEAIKIIYEYSVEYKAPNKKDNIAVIKINGDVIFSGDKEEHKKIIAGWKKKQVPPELKAPIFNTILKKCTPKAISLQDQLNIPPHIPFPMIGMQKE